MSLCASEKNGIGKLKLNNYVLVTANPNVYL